MNSDKGYKAVVIGVSAGGIKVLNTIFGYLNEPFPFPIIIVMHRHPESGMALEKHFEETFGLNIRQVADKDRIQDGMVFFAPPNYHLLLEENRSFSLSIDKPVHFARPAIDILFESAADVYEKNLVGIILTGANGDGALGLKKVKHRGGTAIVQHPDSAEFKDMPQAAIKETQPELVLTIEEIGHYLKNLQPDPNLLKGLKC
jgi:two-component system, chemotaxis family, protein-glutamate methylesterase/glutaminase